MEDQKIETLLNLALKTDEDQRQRSLNLNVGYDDTEKRWDLIVRYSGNLEALKGRGIDVVYLLNNYAILTVPESQLGFVTEQPQIEYIEQPKRLFFAANAGRQASCINTVQSGPDGLSGRGVIVALIDSGLDYTHPDFCNADGTTRILALWDQTAVPPESGTTAGGAGGFSGEAAAESSGEAVSTPGVLPGQPAPVLGPPPGYLRGILYTQEMINEALRRDETQGVPVPAPSMDYSGHGTSVMGIAAGNGRQGGSAYRGVAYESDLLVVKLGNPGAESFPRTTELMQAVNFVIEEGIRRNQPVAINISFGNNYGSHDGTSLLETYINDVSSAGRTLIVIGTGNEGASAGHTAGAVTGNEDRDVPLSVGEYQTGFSVQIWKNFVDIMDVEITAPSGRRTGLIQERLGPVRITLDQTELLIYYGEPRPYSMSQEIYIDFLPVDSYIDTGLWNIRLVPVKIVDGTYGMWLPGAAARNRGTRFLYATPYLTLTIPSTASGALSVGAYNSATGAMADFSGRGNDTACVPVGGCMLKPDLVAPGVDIQTTAAGGGYTVATGTSFATPFVTGSAALLMEWGIVRGNSPYLYGEKLKAYLLAGASPLIGFDRYPNAVTGYGRLCLSNSLNRLL